MPDPSPQAGHAAPQQEFRLVDVTLRDAHQCLWSTRMTTEMMAPIVGVIDRVGYAYINILGGAVFDVCVRYLREDPFERVGLLCQRFATPCDGLTRGQSLYTFELFPDDIVELNSQALARRGLKVLTAYDALNDNRNIESSVRSAHDAGMLVNAMMTYTLSPVHTDDYYVQRARELVALKADFISVKDPTGLLTPQRARTLFPAVVAAAGSVPMRLHSHCQSALSPEVYQIAMQSGFALGDTAVEPLANGASLPAAEEIDRRASRLGIRTGLDHAALRESSEYFGWLAEREGKPRGEIATYDPALYEHQVPGGMISNLKSQLQTMGMQSRLPEILREAAQVRQDLGYPILVSPFAQYIITQAVLNVVQGERYKTVPDEVRKYALGHYGRLAARPSDEFLERARIRDSEISDEPPAARLQGWLPRLRAELGGQASDEDLLLRAFYDKSLIEQLQPRGQRYPERTSPLHELIRYLGSRKDIQRARIRFAGVDLAIGS